MKAYDRYDLDISVEKKHKALDKINCNPAFMQVSSAVWEVRNECIQRAKSIQIAITVEMRTLWFMSWYPQNFLCRIGQFYQSLEFVHLSIYPYLLNFLYLHHDSIVFETITFQSLFRLYSCAFRMCWFVLFLTYVKKFLLWEVYLIFFHSI